jgi:hypothetical protein
MQPGTVPSVVVPCFCNYLTALGDTLTVLIGTFGDEGSITWHGELRLADVAIDFVCTATIASKKCRSLPVLDFHQGCQEYRRSTAAGPASTVAPPLPAPSQLL